VVARPGKAQDLPLPRIIEMIPFFDSVTPFKVYHRGVKGQSEFGSKLVKEVVTPQFPLVMLI
jgi:hypothetical protein